MPAYPAPWELTGTGYVLLFRFSGSFCREKGFIPHPMLGSFRGGLGTVMYVDYRSSNVGPYQELLFIPGRFDFSGRKFYSITKIYVSSRESVEGGRANWGIPKEYASFEKVSADTGVEKIRVQAEGGLAGVFTFKSFPPRLPVTTALIPPRLRTLAHHGAGGTLLTTLLSRGAVSPARLTGCRTDSAFFPPIEETRPLCTVYVPYFTMVFPQAVLL